MKKPSDSSTYTVKMNHWFIWYALTHKELIEQLKALKTKYDKKFEDVYEAICFLLKKEEQPAERNPIGFKKRK